MLTVYDAVDGVLVAREGGRPEITAKTIWIDLHHPTKEEETAVEKALGLLVPTREEMAEIEASSRLYSEGGAHFMTAVVLHQPGTETQLAPIATPVTFILAGSRLVTVRYEKPRAFDIFLARAQKKDAACGSGSAVLVGLIEAVVDREADRVERIQGEVDKLGHGIFDMKGGGMSRTRRFDVAIKQVGREGELTQRSRDCLQSLDRMLTYLQAAMSDRADDKGLRARTKTAQRDVQSLADHVGYLTGKIAFLLDATLGMINIEQNTIIKLFSVASVALMPPTLIASIYGMNFKHMPELEWPFGYPMAICLMIVSAVVPFIYFKKKGWF